MAATEMEFYSEKRWQNWIKQARESDFKISDEPSREGAVFVNMTDDVILACLKVLDKYDKDALSEDEALDALREISDITMEPVDPIKEDVDMMIESVQTSLMAVFVSAERYVCDNYDKDTPLEGLANQAVEAEDREEMDYAFDAATSLGARVFAGEEWVPPEDVPFGLVAEWLDGIDSICAAMLGEQSWREDGAER